MCSCVHLWRDECSGRVVGPAGAVSNIGVRLVAADPANDRTNPPPMLETFAGMTDGSGSFTLLGIRPGQVHRTRPSNWRQDAERRRAGRRRRNQRR